METLSPLSYMPWKYSEDTDLSLTILRGHTSFVDPDTSLVENGFTLTD